MTASMRQWLVLTVALVALAVTGAFIVASIESKPPTQPTSAPLISCPERSLEERINNADLVLTGKVFAVMPVDDLADVLITPQTIFKGAAAENSITIVARPAEVVDGPPSAELHFTSNDPPYLLFLRQRSDGKFLTSVCDGSRKLDQPLSADDEQELRRLIQTKTTA